MRLLLLAGTISVAVGCAPGSEVGIEAQSSSWSPRMREMLRDTDELMARVGLGPSHALELYDAGGGHVGYSVVGVLGENPERHFDGTTVDQLTPEEVYRAFEPGGALPVRLHDFMMRFPVNAGRVRPEAADLEVTTQPLYTDLRDGTSDCNESTFRNMQGPFGPFCPTNGAENFCDIWRAFDTRTWSNRRSRGADGAACAWRGTNNFLVNFGNQRHTFTQLQGTWRQFHIAAGCSWFTCDNLQFVEFALSPPSGVPASHMGGRWFSW